VRVFPAALHYHEERAGLALYRRVFSVSAHNRWGPIMKIHIVVFAAVAIFLAAFILAYAQAAGA
jgi:hypothetical protein